MFDSAKEQNEDEDSSLRSWLRMAPPFSVNELISDK